MLVYLTPRKLVTIPTVKKNILIAFCLTKLFLMTIFVLLMLGKLDSLIPEFIPFKENAAILGMFVCLLGMLTVKIEARIMSKK